ncbi:MAG: uracil-DNA glycosylase [Alphaproteobacteria bacterium]|nr:uracil-DNA glycosylase [Alphaproteobacteria bacterium]
MDLIQKLRWWITAGVEESIGDAPQNRMKPAPAQPSAADKANPVVVQAEQAARACADIAALNRAKEEADCPLKKTSAHTIVGRGSEHPVVLCIAESPGAADDKADRLFAGETGELVDRMLAAVGLDLATNAYAAVLIPWRPPGNRAPTPVEIATCLPFLRREIELLKPQFLLLFGNAVVEALLGIRTLPKARGIWHEYTIEGGTLPAVATLAPATLKTPAQKKLAWQDLQLLQEKLPK